MDDEERKIINFAEVTNGAIRYASEAIKKLSDSQNKNLVKIIELICNSNKLVENLPSDDFKTKMKTALLEELKMCNCYSHVDGPPINCLDFYNNYLKRKEVNSQILKEVEKQQGGMVGIMLTAAITALAILNSSISVTASVFNSDKFVDQQLAKRGIDPNAKEPPSFYNSANKTILSVFSKSESNPNVLSGDELHRYNELEKNIAGKCVYLSYIAEICTGGCPTEEEWLKRDPNIVNKIINSQSYKDDHRAQQLISFAVNYSPDSIGMVGTKHMIGVGLAEKYATNVPEESKRDPKWFRKYFSSGDTNYKKGDKSDVAIATIFIPGHALNMLYNRNTQKLCIHEVNYDSYFSKPSYICEKGFFTEEQLDKLNKNRSIVKLVKDGRNIFDSYERMSRQRGVKINYITPSEKIFIHDNEKNTGSISEYINIHERVNDIIIEGQREAVKVMKKNIDKWFMGPDVVDIMNDLASNAADVLRNPSKAEEYEKKRQQLFSDGMKHLGERHTLYQSEMEKSLEKDKENVNEYLKKTRALVPYEPEMDGGKRKTKQRNRKSRRSRSFKKKRR